jgi:hypothetical protein
MTPLEKDMLIVTVQLEASICSYYEKQLIIDVIKNRTIQKYMSDGTIIDTCIYPYQFSCWNDDNFDNVKKMLLWLDKNQEEYTYLSNLVDYAWNTKDESNGSLLYYSPAAMGGKLPDWNFSLLKNTINTEYFKFYKLKNG